MAEKRIKTGAPEHTPMMQHYLVISAYMPHSCWLESILASKENEEFKAFEIAPAIELEGWS